MTTAERRRENLIDAIAFAFVTVAVQQMQVRPSPRAIASFRQRVSAALHRSGSEPWGSDEPTEPHGSGAR